MAITNFIPELWSAAVQVPFERALVYAQGTVSNRRYEGEISQMGDTVHVTSIADPTIRTYDKSTDLTTEDLDDSSTSLVIDQGQYFSFRVNDVDRVQAAGDFQGPATARAGYRLKDGLDSYVAGLYTSALTANQLGSIEVAKSAPGGAYDILVELAVALTKADCPTDGRYVVVPPEFHGVLQRDDRFVRVDASGTDQTLRNGLVGRAAGFDILLSNNAPTTDDGERVVMAGIPDAISVAEQITQTEALRAQARFADIVRGLHVFGAQTFQPAGLATALVEVVDGGNGGGGTQQVFITGTDSSLPVTVEGTADVAVTGQPIQVDTGDAGGAGVQAESADLGAEPPKPKKK
ncbi:coat protein [Spiractinospora alimapuensis]|uniref:coat protein n=1 Tax=Spiractinospora alimapuensis TaxID=2820884 RepID=UPI001F27C5F8|nr:coat protein [Spiractinospora alimapuensis]QVQ51305.1 coat protein [Spiractinospora alimapuensis]